MDIKSLWQKLDQIAEATDLKTIPETKKKKPDADKDGVPDWADKKPGKDDNEEKEDVAEGDMNLSFPPKKKKLGPDMTDPYEQGWFASSNVGNPYEKGTSDYKKWQNGRTERESQPEHYDESVSKKTPGIALSKGYKKNFDGKKPVQDKPDTALTGTYSKTGKPGGTLKKKDVAESEMSSRIGDKGETIRKHTAKAGGYGRRDASEKDIDTDGAKEYDTETLARWLIGNLPKKLNTLGKTSVKHKLKEHMQRVESNKLMESFIVEAEDKLTEIESILQDINHGNIDINDIIIDKYVPTSDIEAFVASKLKDKYDQIAQDNGLDTEQDSEQIYEIIMNELHNIMLGNDINDVSDDIGLGENDQAQAQAQPDTTAPIMVQGKAIGTAPDAATAAPAHSILNSVNAGRKELGRMGVKIPGLVDENRKSRSKKLTEAINLENIMEGTLEEVLAVYPHEHKMCQEGWGMDEGMFSALCDHYHKDGRIPRDVWHGPMDKLRDHVEQCYLQDTQPLMGEEKELDEAGVSAFLPSKAISPTHNLNKSLDNLTNTLSPADADTDALNRKSNDEFNAKDYSNYDDNMGGGFSTPKYPDLDDRNAPKMPPELDETFDMLDEFDNEFDKAISEIGISANHTRDFATDDDTLLPRDPIRGFTPYKEYTAESKMSNKKSILKEARISQDDFDKASIAKGKRGRDARDNPAKAVAAAKRSPTAQTAKKELAKLRSSNRDVSKSDVQLDEKFDKEAKLNPAKKDMFKGKTKAELQKQLTALKKSGPHKKGSKEYTKQNELEFALRAKSGWGKVKEVKESYNFSKWDRQLASLISESANGKSKSFIKEDITVNITKSSTPGSNSVNVSATGEESDMLMQLINNAGLGGTEMGQSQYRSAEPTAQLGMIATDDEGSCPAEPFMHDEVIDSLGNDDIDSGEDSLSFLKKMLTHGQSPVDVTVVGSSDSDSDSDYSDELDEDAAADKKQADIDNKWFASTGGKGQGDNAPEAGGKVTMTPGIEPPSQKAKTVVPGQSGSSIAPVQGGPATGPTAAGKGLGVQQPPQEVNNGANQNQGVKPATPIPMGNKQTETPPAAAAPKAAAPTSAAAAPKAAVPKPGAGEISAYSDPSHTTEPQMSRMSPDEYKDRMEYDAKSRAAEKPTTPGATATASTKPTTPGATATAPTQTQPKYSGSYQDFQKENPGASYGQFMNAQQGLTAIAGGKNDPNSAGFQGSNTIGGKPVSTTGTTPSAGSATTTTTKPTGTADKDNDYGDETYNSSRTGTADKDQAVTKPESGLVPAQDFGSEKPLDDKDDKKDGNAELDRIQNLAGIRQDDADDFNPLDSNRSDSDSGRGSTEFNLAKGNQDYQDYKQNSPPDQNIANKGMEDDKDEFNTNSNFDDQPYDTSGTSPEIRKIDLDTPSGSELSSPTKSEPFSDIKIPSTGLNSSNTQKGPAPADTKAPEIKAAPEPANPAPIPVTKASDTSSEPLDEDDEMDEGAGTMHFKNQQAKKAGETSFKLGNERYPVKEDDTTITSNGDNSEETSEEDSDAVRDAGLASSYTPESKMNENDIVRRLMEKLNKIGNSSKKCNECGDMMEDDHDCSGSEILDEWANSPSGNSKDEQFQTDTDFMTKRISGGLNNQKQDQTTLGQGPVRVKTAGEMQDVNLSMGALLEKLRGIN